MKKLMKTMMLIISITLSASSYAQTFNIRAGFNLAKMEIGIPDDFEENYKPGFHIGVTKDIPISEKFFFETGVLLSNKGNKIVVIFDPAFSTQEDDLIKSTGITDLYYLNFPLVLKRYINIKQSKVYISGGGYMAVGLFGKLINKASVRNGEVINRKDNIDWGNEPHVDAFQRFDSGLHLGLGVSVKNIEIGINYNLGILNISASSSRGFTAKNRVLALSMAYKLVI